MTPHKQLFLHDPDNHIYGDCWRTCIACLLNIKPEQVPHFYTKEMQDAEQVQTKMNEWLNAGYGLKTVDIPFLGDSLEDVQQCFKVRNDGVHYILTGKSKNSNVNHCVICRNGEIIHDPAIDDSGIAAPCDLVSISGRQGFYWVGFLVFDAN